MKFFAVFITLLFAAPVTPLMAQTDTTFTYQGELSESGTAANGTFDMEFSLWDSTNGGIRFGPPVQLMDVLVHEGIFAVALDFGAYAFDNSMRWLEISVDGVILSPRQVITRTPYAIQTRGIHVNEDLKVGIGTTALEDSRVTIRSPTTGGAIIARTDNVNATTISAYQQALTGTGRALLASNANADGYAGVFIGGRNYFEGNVVF